MAHCQKWSDHWNMYIGLSGKLKDINTNKLLTHTLASNYTVLSLCHLCVIWANLMPGLVKPIAETSYSMVQQVTYHGSHPMLTQSGFTEWVQYVPHTLFMQRPLLHVNCPSPQAAGAEQLCSVTFSSAPSTQSGSPSHSHLRGMHCARFHILFSLQVNSVSSSHVRASANI